MSKKVGNITQIIGPIVDVQFKGNLPIGGWFAVYFSVSSSVGQLSTTMPHPTRKKGGNHYEIHTYMTSSGCHINLIKTFIFARLCRDWDSGRRRPGTPSDTRTSTTIRTSEKSLFE